MITPEITTAIEDIIAPTMRRMGYQSMRVDERANHAGHPVLLVHLDYADASDRKRRVGQKKARRTEKGVRIRFSASGNVTDEAWAEYIKSQVPPEPDDDFHVT